MLSSGFNQWPQPGFNESFSLKDILNVRELPQSFVISKKSKTNEKKNLRRDAPRTAARWTEGKRAAKDFTVTSDYTPVSSRNFTEEL